MMFYFYTTGYCIIIPDTEIDWIAYMQEVQGYEDGERNYFNLKGMVYVAYCYYPPSFYTKSH